MEISNQAQKAGDGSTQIQAGTINIISGIDESRARVICKEEWDIAIKEFTEEAKVIANERVQKLEDLVIPKLHSYDNTLSIFADPSFQVTLRKAQLSAACTNDESGFVLLSDLLLHRVEQDGNVQRKLGINKAIEIVDQISSDALIGLSIAYAVMKFSPRSNNLNDGLCALDSLYSTIISHCNLPNGNDWLEHLDLLSVIRLGVEGIGKFKTIDEHIPNVLSNYILTGLEANSNELKVIQDEFVNAGIPLSIFVDNPLRHGYKILNIQDINNACIIHNANGMSIKYPLTNMQKEIIVSAMNKINVEGSSDSILRNAFMEKWDSFPTLKIVREWWNSIDMTFSFSPSGIALVNAYIHGKDPRVPAMY